MLTTARKIAIFIAGFLVVIVGLILSIPGVWGPGFLVIFAGLSILATEFAWARRLLNKCKDAVRRATERWRGRKRAAPTGEMSGAELPAAAPLMRDETLKPESPTPAREP